MIWDNAEQFIEFDRPLPDSEKAHARLKAGDISADAFKMEWRLFANSVADEERQLKTEIGSYGWGNGDFFDWKEEHSIDVSYGIRMNSA